MDYDDLQQRVGEPEGEPVDGMPLEVEPGEAIALIESCLLYTSRCV